MKRPYTICHVLSSVDGNISGQFFSDPALKEVSQAFAQIRDKYACQGYVYGSKTVAQTYADILNAKVPEDSSEISFKTELITPVKSNVVFFDVNPDGLIFWNKGSFSKRNFRDAKIVEILTEKTPKTTRAELENRGIDYFIAGEKQFNPKLALEKIYTYYGIKKLMISGGGILDWTFLEAGLIDEVSIVVAPLTDGLTNRASIFDRSSLANYNETIGFTLNFVKKLPGNAVWLNYKPKNIIP